MGGAPQVSSTRPTMCRLPLSLQGLPRTLRQGLGPRILLCEGVYMAHGSHPPIRNTLIAHLLIAHCALPIAHYSLLIATCVAMLAQPHATYSLSPKPTQSKAAIEHDECERHWPGLRSDEPSRIVTGDSPPRHNSRVQEVPGRKGAQGPFAAWLGPGSSKASTRDDRDDRFRCLFPEPSDYRQPAAEGIISQRPGHSLTQWRRAHLARRQCEGVRQSCENTTLLSIGLPYMGGVDSRNRRPDEPGERG